MALNPNCKIDKPALHFPDPADLLAAAKRRASSVIANMTDTQARLAAVWASVLPDRSARMFVPDSNIFDEGGHSLLAQQIFSISRANGRISTYQYTKMDNIVANIHHVGTI